MAFRLRANGGGSRALSVWLLLAQAAISLLDAAPSSAVMLSEGRAVAATWADTRVDRFDGVGRVECLDNQQRVQHLATGWVLGSSDTVVTAAHLFFHQAAKVIEPSKCVFVLYDRDQRVRDRVSIRYGVSPWADRLLLQDSSYDVAVLKLERPVHVVNIPAVKIMKAAFKPSIELIAFQSVVENRDRVWITRGQMRNFPVSQLRNDRGELRITDATRLFSTSVSSSPSSSGGMYYDQGQEAAVGIHVGSVCDQARPSYDPAGCFNFGVRFDAKIVAMVSRVVEDQPVPQAAIRSPDAPALQFALVDLPGV